MFQAAKLIEWYYQADYSFLRRKKYPKILESLDTNTLRQIRKVINSIVTDKELSEIIVSALDCVGQGVEISAVNCEYLEKLSQCDAKKLSWKKWDCLRFLMCGKGLLQMSHVCREKAISRLCECSKAYGALRRFAYEIERGNYGFAYDLIKSRSFLFLKLFDKKQYMQCEDICVTLNGEKRITDEFGELIEGKRVVILGPASHDKGMPDYDQDKDIIARFSYRGKEYLPECDKEIPTDISYYSSYNTYAKYYGVFCTLSKTDENLKYFCYKLHDGMEQLAKFPKQRYIHVFEPCIMFGHAYMMPNAVFDCLHYNMSSIYVRNCNLYMAKKYYDNKYSIIENMSSSEWLYAFAKHDYEGQFNLLKSLYMAGKFQCDEECSNIMTLSIDEYIQNMEIIYAGK